MFRKIHRKAGNEEKNALPFFQPKKISSPGDRYETEADAIAESIADQSSSTHRHSISRMQNDDVHAKTINSSDKGIASAGSELPVQTKAFFEKKMGHDFSKVRIHTGQDAVSSARSMNALAYTSGNHIVFNNNQYQPTTSGGKKLLAHELTHVVQQQNSSSFISRKVEVPTGTKIDMEDKHMSRDGNIYTRDEPDRSGSADLEIFTSLLHSPRVFKPQGSTSAEVTGMLMRHIRARLGVLQWAKDAKFKFGAGKNFRMNSEYWWWGKNNSFGFNDDVDRDKARRDALENKNDDYYIACDAAAKIVMKGGGESEMHGDSSTDEKDWVPGDAGWIKNDKWNGGAGTEGENIIYIGARKFWGHHPGERVRTFKQWMEEVRSWNDGNPTLTNDRSYPEKGLKF